MLRRFCLFLIVALPTALIASGLLCLTDSLSAILSCLLLAPLYLPACFGYLTAGTLSRRLVQQRIVVIAISLLATVSTFTNWPLRLSFALARPALERLVTETYNAVDGRKSVEYLLGLVEARQIYRNRSAGGTMPGYIGIWLNDPPPGYEFRGFVYSDCGNYPGNLATDIDLGGGWRYVIED